MLGYPPTPPPPRGAWRLTARPADPQGLGQPRGGGSPPLQPPKLSHTPRGHTLAGGGPRIPLGAPTPANGGVNAEVTPLVLLTGLLVPVLLGPPLWASLQPALVFDAFTLADGVSMTEAASTLASMMSVHRSGRVMASAAACPAAPRHP